MAEIKRTGNAIWRGDLRSGRGHLSTETETLKDERYTFKTRFGDASGTNPEELIAAAHAACYSMAFANTLSQEGFEPQAIETEATIILSPQEGGGFAITKSHLVVRGTVPEIDPSTFEEIAEQADQGCPVSILLRPGLEIELEATLG